MTAPGEDFPYCLKRAFGARGALRAALARRPRAPRFTGPERQKSADAPKDTDAHVQHGHHRWLTVRSRTRHPAADPVPHDLHAGPRRQGRSASLAR
jgi:hypothetical protein